jgi:NAD+ kinase
MASRISSPSTAIHPALAHTTPLEGLESLIHTSTDRTDNLTEQRPRTSYNTASPSSLLASDSPTSLSDLQGPSDLQAQHQQHQQSPQQHADRLGEPAALRRPQSARAHHGTLDTVPCQTIIKALASVARNHKPEALSLSSVLNATMQASLPVVEADSDRQPATAGEPTAQQPTSLQPPTTAQFQPATGKESSSQQLCDALNDLALRNNATPTTTAAAAAFSGLKSPCYYHQRFDDAVDIEKVLEEIKNDEYMSHSRLVQTATGVREVSKQLQRRPIRRAVRNIMIVTKARDNQLVVLTRELAQWLLSTPRYGSDVGVNVYVDAKLRNSKRFGAASLVAADPRFESMLRYWTPDLCWSQPEKFDLVITLGGDGTVLFTSWLFQRIVPPVLSFSLGSLGFLTTFEFERFRYHLDRIMGNEGMRVNLRMRFTCTVYRDGTTPGEQPEEGEQFEVLNELVIDRGPSPYVSNLELYGDDELLTVVQADGCIFSTPTGKPLEVSSNV